MIYLTSAFVVHCLSIVKCLSSYEQHEIDFFNIQIMGADQSKQLENTLFNLKFSAKSLVRESKKCEKAEKEEKTKLKKAIEKGNTEGARIYAENAIRNKSQVRSFFYLLSPQSRRSPYVYYFDKLFVRGKSLWKIFLSQNMPS